MLCENNVTKRFSFSFENDDAPPLPIQKLLTNLYYVSKIENLIHFRPCLSHDSSVPVVAVAGRCQKPTLPVIFSMLIQL